MSAQTQECEFKDYVGIHIYSIDRDDDSDVDQEDYQHAVNIVAEWLDFNSARFTIPGTEWGRELVSELRFVLCMAQEFVNAEFPPKPASDSRYFRRPYAVQSTRRLYNGMGQTDPETQTFAFYADAIAYSKDMIEEGRDAYLFVRNPVTGEWDG
ncbi:hypothetical protein SEA_A3WALLY_288 [Microbacterium phage A3Wally]|nr:hypothetical protein SEA_A3WALLY_288 [Microbacterium phage A3Wally]